MFNKVLSLFAIAALANANKNIHALSSDVLDSDGMENVKDFFYTAGNTFMERQGLDDFLAY